uniref:Reverse transcriptase Ty1/copia-type domain-containing protein n=1 Tax=Solanum lycopersicum TaxID=4081 RepID=A0A3Q7ED88_SOLLC
MTPAYDATPTPSPPNVASPSSQESSSEIPHMMKSIQELYDDTEEITNFDFLFHSNGDILLVCLYVDDLILMGNNPALFKAFNKAMSLEFEMTDIGLMSYYLGLEVKQMEEGIFISQASYTKDILKKFNMFDCNPSLIGSLRYLTCTRPDIIFAVGVVSCFMEDPTSTHLKVAKRILRYLKGTIELGLFYSSSDDFNLVGYCDSDYEGHVYDRKST